MPLKLSAFPKCYLEEIAGARTMSIFDWITMAKTLDADGLEQLLSATAVADPERPPYGVDRRLWQRMCELADELASALVDGDEPDVVETQAVAGELHDLLRPYV